MRQANFYMEFSADLAAKVREQLPKSDHAPKLEKEEATGSGTTIFYFAFEAEDERDRDRQARELERSLEAMAFA